MTGCYEILFGHIQDGMFKVLYRYSNGIQGGVIGGQQLCLCFAFCSYFQASLKIWGVARERKRDRPVFLLLRGSLVPLSYDGACHIIGGHY